MRFSVSINNQQAHPIIQLKDKETGCIALIYAFGGLVNNFSIPLNNKPHNCIAGFSSVADARKNIAYSFAGAKLSPFVCRMRDGAYKWDQKKYKVHKHYLGAHAIHGLVYDLVYDIKDQVATEDFAKVILEKKYNATDQGYPFPYTIQLTWKLEANNRLSVNTIVYHDNKVAIPYADGWHPYFSLGGKVDACTLQCNATEIVDFDAELLPTGALKKDTRFQKGLLLKDISLDNSFILDPKEPSNAILSNKNLSLIIEPSAAYPILQVYTPPHRNSIAIENLSGAPDNFNNQIGLLVLEPAKKYSFTTSYQLSTI
jgi:aldose 1-epimerase